MGKGCTVASDHLQQTVSNADGTREFDRDHVNLDSAKVGRKFVCLIVEILGEAGVITTAAITLGASFSERRITTSEPLSAIQRISR